MAGQFSVKDASKLGNVSLPLTNVAWGVGAKLASNIMGASGVNELLGFPNNKDAETYLLKSYFEYNKGLGVVQKDTYKTKTLWLPTKSFEDTSMIEDDDEVLGIVENETIMGEDSYASDGKSDFSVTKVDRYYKVKRKIKKGKELAAVDGIKKYEDGDVTLNFAPDWQDMQYTGDYYTNDFVRMFALNLQTNEVLCIPCLYGSPRISLRTETNERPMASNTTPITTSIMVKPKEFNFRFPIAYLSVYGTNIESEEYRLSKRGWASKTKAWITKAENKVDKWTNDVLSKIKMGSGDDRDRMFKGQQVARQQNTIEQIYNKLMSFHNSAGVILYTGFDSKGIRCSCNIDISFADGDNDAVMVEMQLKELVFFNANWLKGKLSNHNVTPTATKNTSNEKVLTGSGSGNSVKAGGGLTN